MVDYLEGEREAPRSVDPRYAALRRRYAAASAALVTAFLSWYAAYLLLSVFARDLLAVRVAGSVNIALLLGVGQFASTFLLAWLFARYAERRLDPLADEVRAAAGDLPDPGEVLR
ncbi:DUF485 domain-containing protein [Nocardiopsis coralliicola]